MVLVDDHDTPCSTYGICTRSLLTGYRDHTGLLEGMAPPADETYAETLFNLIPPPYPFRHPDYPPPETFLHFPDTHLDENLILKRICILPSLFDDTLRSLDTLFPSAAQAKLRDDLFAFPASAYSDLSNKHDVVDVREAYVRGVAFACNQIVSGVILNPDTPTAIPIIGWDVNPVQLFANHNTTFHDESFVFGFRNYSDKLFEQFSASSQERIRTIEEHFPVFAIGMMLCPNGEWCLEDMDTLAPPSDDEEQFSDFPWVANSIPTGHAPTPNAIRPADADDPIWRLPNPPPLTTSTLRKSARSSASRARHGLRKSPPKKSPTNFRPKDIRPAPPRPIPAVELIQRAWIKAVRFDVTVILFDCGNFLRIGIRQRGTQTLFLSSLIEPCKRGSKYGRLMLGLHLCILHDVFARLPHASPSAGAESESPSSTTSLKRSADHLPQESPPKRGRTTESGAERTRRPSTTSRSSRPQDRITPAKSTRSDKKNFPSDLRIRTRGYFESHPVLALYLRFHNYNSPTPEVLLSPDHPRSTIYKATTCLPLILTSKLGHGATGQAYTAILGPGYENLPYSRLVVKLADTKKNLLSLRHEYDVYCHLQSAGVLGIPYIFGYYQDSLRGMGALVMHDVGNPLGRRMDGNKKIKLSATERASLKKILKAIHAKGVLHRDLRSWNMMCNQHGEVSIIDFDRASLKASKEEFSHETARLARFLKGEFVDRDSVIGSHDMPSDMSERIVNRNES